MIAALRSISDRLLGRGTAALTVPPMDGALRPNNLLEEAPAGIAANAPDCLALKNGQAVWAEGTRLMSADGEIGSKSGEITAIATSKAGRMAIAIDDSGIEIDGETPKDLSKIACVTALAFENDNILWIAVGSTVNAIGEWSRDFLERRNAGRVLRYEISTGTLKVICDRLAYPKGMLWTSQGLLVSEAWNKRVIQIDISGKMTQLIEDLPGYPAGLAHTHKGGYWLALFAPRSPLMELVLREPAYRRAMMSEVEPDYWIAPALSSGDTFLEPMQGGALKQMGVLKPWAPTRSYGLLLELNAQFTPVRSLHSRAGGRRHGITTVLEVGNAVWATSKGGNEVLRIETAGEKEQ